jgi:hypothetical protein
MSRPDEIYVGGYQGHDQLDPADSLAGELREDPLDAGYSPPDREPPGLRVGTTEAETWRHETHDERLAEEEPDLTDDPAWDDVDVDRREVRVRAGRLVAPVQGALDDDEATEIATDVGPAGWASSAEEAAVHLVPESDDSDDDFDGSDGSDGSGDWGEDREVRADIVG